jgi:hypothetical protein
MKCSICGCEKYTKHGNTTGGKWVYRCSNGHTWAAGSINDPFPWREDDYHHPKNYEWNIRGDYVRKGA